MTRFEAWLLHLATFILAASGIAFAVAKYLLPHDDPFAATGAWWQPWALSGHVLAAPVFLFALGLLFRRHVLAKLRDPRSPGRGSGVLLLGVIAVAALSGHLLQVLTADGSRVVTSLLHLAAGGAVALAYGAHLAIGARAAISSLGLTPAEAPPGVSGVHGSPAARTGPRLDRFRDRRR